MVRSKIFRKVPGAVLISILIFYGCKKTESTTVVAPIIKPDTTKPAIKLDTIAGGYLALGDSYTIGQSVPSNQAYPAQLENFLNVANFSTPPPTIIAITGWTTDNLIYAIAHSTVLNNRYAFVTLLIGANDQFEGSTQAHYRTNFIQLLHTAITFAQGDSTRVFVLSIPDYGVTPFAMGRDSIIGPQIDQFNAINKQESLNAGVNYLDITGISREAAADTTLIAPDGLHPSGKMYKLWIDQLGPMVLKRLQQK
jgi:lysophospholipase L1-like esterase